MGNVVQFPFEKRRKQVEMDRAKNQPPQEAIRNFEGLIRAASEAASKRAKDQHGQDVDPKEIREAARALVENGMDGNDIFDVITRVYNEQIKEKTAKADVKPNQFKSVGSRYHETKRLDVADIAKLIRKDIKAAIKRGEIPKIKTSVRIERFSMGSSIDVKVKSVPEGFRVINPEWVKDRVFRPHDPPRTNVLSQEAQDLQDKIERIRESYGYDNSDPMTDYFHVRYYGKTEFCHELRGAEVNQIKSEIQERAGS